MVSRRTNVSNRFETESTASMAPTALSISVLNTSGSPATPAIMIIEPDVVARVEVVLFNGAFTGTSFSTTSLVNRYLAGSAAGSGITHPVGSRVVCVPLAQHIEDLHDRVDGRVARAGDTMTGTLTVPSVIAQLANGKLNSALIGTYPDGVSTAAVISSNGWPAGGVLRTVKQEGGEYSSQTLIERSGETRMFHRSILSGAWSDWATEARSARSSYTGNGASSRTIALPFTPGFVVVTNRTSGSSFYSGVGAQTNTAGASSLPGVGVAAQSTDGGRPRCVANGFVISTATNGTNVNGDVYDYMAIG